MAHSLASGASECAWPPVSALGKWLAAPVTGPGMLPEAGCWWFGGQPNVALCSAVSPMWATLCGAVLSGLAQLELQLHMLAAILLTNQDACEAVDAFL